MKGKLQIYYDEQGDFLELHQGPYRSGSFKNLGKGVFERIDAETKEVTGIAIHGFRKKIEQVKDARFTLPISVEFSS